MLYYKATAGCGVGMFVGVSACKRAAPVALILGRVAALPPPFAAFLSPSPPAAHYRDEHSPSQVNKSVMVWLTADRLRPPRSGSEHEKKRGAALRTTISERRNARGPTRGACSYGQHPRTGRSQRVGFWEEEPTKGPFCARKKCTPHHHPTTPQGNDGLRDLE